MSSIGTTWAYPPPHAPPFTPNTGPSDGSRMQSAAFLPSFRRAWVTPTVTVDFPSPAGVGLIPVTSTSRPVGLRRAKAWSRIFALYCPYSAISSSASPSSVAISATGRSFAAWAIAMSVGTLAVVVTGPLGLERGSKPRSEQPPRVLRRARSDRLERLPAGPGECLGHLAREPRLVPPAAMRHGGEVGCVRLNQEPVCRTVGQSDRGVPGPERDHAREGKIRADGHPRFEHLRARAERVQHDDRPDAPSIAATSSSASRACTTTGLPSSAASASWA